MAPKPATAKIDLGFPLYCCDFDPRNPNFLLVGGGGGESRSGVPNKILLLDASQKDRLSEAVDIELSTQEDNVQTLAICQSTDQWATVYAGINSSQQEQERGVNDHLRSFLLEYPPKRRTNTEGAGEAPGNVDQGYTGQTKALGRAALFTPSAAVEKLTYQRVLRLSKRVDDNGPRLGVVATGLAPEGEVVVFAADTSRPSNDDVRRRLNLGEKIEAADVDIIGLEPDEKRGEGNFRVAYCTDYDIYCTDVNYTYNRPDGMEPQSIYGTSHDYASASNLPPPKLRCLRFLTPTLVLVLQNLPKQAGSEVFVMELTGARLAHIPLHGKIKNATGLSVTTLPYPEGSNFIQHAVAIAGADRSITILTIDHPACSPYGRKLAFKKYAFLPKVHENSIMSLTFSEHTAPNTPYISAPTQYLKLASTSMVNTCVVHTMVLAPYPGPTSEKDRPAYLLSSPTKQSMTQNTLSVIVAILAIAIGSFFLQAFTEIRGGAPEYLGVKQWLNPAVHDWIARPYMFEDGIKSAWSRSINSEVETASSFISSVIETPSSLVSEAGSTVSSAASSVASPAVEQVTKVTSKASSAASSIASSVSSKASEGSSMVSSSASEEISGASSVLSEAASSASSSMTEGASSISSKINKGASSASSASSSAASSASSFASDATSPLASSASEAASSASSAATDAASTISTHANDAAFAAASAAEAMASSASKAASSASSIAATDAAAEPLASSALVIASSASSLASSAASEASASASSFVAGASTPSDSAASSVSSGAADVYDAVSQSATSAATAVSEGASLASSSASSGAADAYDAVSQSATSAATAVSEGASHAPSSVSSGAADAYDTVSDSASSAATAVPEGGSHAASSVSSSAADAYDNVSNSATSAATAVSEGASHAASAAFSATADLAEGTQEVLGLRALLAKRDSGAIRKQEEGGDDVEPNKPHEIVVRHDDGDDGEKGKAKRLSVETHPPETVVEREMPVKRWEDLDGEEKAGWRQRLHDAGEWTLEEGEAILQGVLFSGLGGVVGAAFGG